MYFDTYKYMSWQTNIINKAFKMLYNSKNIKVYFLFDNNSVLKVTRT